MTARATRSQLLGSLIAAAVLQSRTQWRVYAANVVLHYHDTVAVDDRELEFFVATTADNHEHVSRLNTQKVRRILSGESPLLANLEESLVNALPDPHRDEVMAALLARDGLILARRPPARGDVAGQVATPCELLRSAAGAVERIAPMLANGSIGPEDRPHFVAALKSINEVMGVCITLNAQIADAMEQGGTTQPALQVVR